jgi:hypothetical protein
MPERNREFVICFEVAESIRVRVRRTTCLGAKIVRVDFEDFTGHAMKLGVGIVCPQITD